MTRWAMVADDNECEGLFVITEAKYGWTARSGNLGLSLLRSPRMPQADEIEARTVPAGEKVPGQISLDRLRELGY